VRAYSRLGLSSGAPWPFLALCAKQLGGRAFEEPCTGAQLGNIAAGFAKADYADPELWNHLCGLTARLGPSNFDAAAVANLLHAFAAVRRPDPTALAMLSVRAREIPSGQFDAQHMATMLHALATLGHSDPPLVQHLISGALRARQTSLYERDINAQCCSNMAWAAAVLKVPDLQFHRWLLGVLAGRISGMDALSLSQVHQYLLALELEGLGVEEPDEKLPINGPKSHEISNPSSLNVTLRRSLKSTILQPAMERLMPFRPLVEASFRRFASASAASSPTADLNTLISRDCSHHARTSSGVLMHSCDDASSRPNVTGRSHLQKDVVDSLLRLLSPKALRAASTRPHGANMEAHGAHGLVEEFVCPVTGYTLDIWLPDPLGGPGIGIEVDGPSHFCAAQGCPPDVGSERWERIPLGSTLMKRRQMHAVGYRLFSVAYWDWTFASASHSEPTTAVVHSWSTSACGSTIRKSDALASGAGQEREGKWERRQRLRAVLVAQGFPEELMRSDSMN